MASDLNRLYYVIEYPSGMICRGDDDQKTPRLYTLGGAKTVVTKMRKRWLKTTFANVKPFIEPKIKEIKLVINE